MATDQSIVIKFKSTGSKALTRAIQNLTDAERELRGETKRLRKENNLLGTGFKRNSKNAGMLNNAFSTMRSKLLLVNFAMGMGIAQLVRFAKEAAKIDAMATAFTTLQGGTENASIAIDKLSEAVDGTMSKFDLFQQANNAMILGVSKNSDEMAEMFDMAQRLGQALGKTAKESVESLITGIGRQSRLMLDNIGIIVRADEAYQDYALEINKTVDSLTDADKKQAFLTATLESARQKVSELPEEVNDANMSFERFSSTVKNLTAELGDKLKGALSGVMDGFVNLVELEKSNQAPSLVAERNALAWEHFKSATSWFWKENAIRKELREARELQARWNEEIGETIIEFKDLGQTLFEDKDFGEAVTFFSKEDLDTTDEDFQKLMKSMKKEAQPVINAMNSMSGALASAIINGEHMGMAVENSIKRIAAEFVAKAAIFKSMFLLLSIFAPGSAALKLMSPTGSLLNFALGVAHTGGLIKDNKVQKFATGGVVEGQDNVPILAQNGEFVMSRRAVESVGIETMNRINQTGSAGVNITLNNPIMTQDFVEGELAEAIRNAARRGTDFGVS